MEEYTRIELKKDGSLNLDYYCSIEDRLELWIDDANMSDAARQSVDWLRHEYNVKAAYDERMRITRYRFVIKDPRIIADRIAAREQAKKLESFPLIDLPTARAGTLPDRFRVKLTGIDAESAILQFHLAYTMRKMGRMLEDSTKDGKDLLVFFKAP